jgi:hypothetical protein
LRSTASGGDDEEEEEEEISYRHFTSFWRRKSHADRRAWLRRKECNNKDKATKGGLVYSPEDGLKYHKKLLSLSPSPSLSLSLSPSFSSSAKRALLMIKNADKIRRKSRSVY